MISETWEDRTSEELVSPEALSLVEHANLLADWFGEWPTFQDSEVLSMNFDRGNHDWVVRTGAWNERVPPSLTATFYVFDPLRAHDDPRRKTCEATIRFEEFAQFEMDGFNHQNPIVGLSLGVQRSESVGAMLLLVNWGGTGIRHEVSFLCSRARVLSVRAIGVA